MSYYIIHVNKARYELEPNHRLHVWSEYSYAIHEFIEKNDLNDVWRTVNLDTRLYTWRGNTRNGLVQSRLDYWLVSVHMLYGLNTVSISPGLRSQGCHRPLIP